MGTQHTPQNTNANRDQSAPGNDSTPDVRMDVSGTRPINLSPKLESLTAERLVEMLGQTARLRFEGASRICLEGSKESLGKGETLSEGRCLIDLQFPWGDQDSSPSARCILVGSNENDARRILNSLPQTGVPYQPVYYWFSEVERQRLCAMLPALKPESSK